MQEATTITTAHVKRTCDGCGKVYEFDIVNGETSPETTLELQNWYTSIREIFDGEQWVKGIRQSCCFACVSVAAASLALPPQRESGVDLNALRAGDPRIN
jgi:hypothetical protein